MSGSWQDDGSLWALWKEIQYRWSKAGMCALPRVHGVTGLDLARWVYQTHVETSQWCPFVHVKWDERVGKDEWLWLSARGGVLYIECDDPEDLPMRCVKLAKQGAYVLLVQGMFDEQLSVRAVELIRRASSHHLVATDPDLTRLRQGLMLQAQNAGQVHLNGESGDVALPLVEWVHASLDDRPMTQVRASEAVSHVQGQWLCFEQLGQLSEANRRFLLAQMEARQQRHRQGYHRLANATRPTHEAASLYLGHSSQTVDVLEALIEQAPGSRSVHLRGEVGVGKSILARVAHALFECDGVCVEVDLGTLGSSWEEALDDAYMKADRGTLYLKHVDHWQAAQQVRLLSLLRSGRADVRVVSSAVAYLEPLVRRGQFRGDLYSRLMGLSLEVDPLRARLVDLDDLVAFKLGQLWGEVPSPCCTREAWRVLRGYHWPGNVGQLWQVLEQVVAQHPQARVLGEDAFEHLIQLARPVPLFTVSLGEQAPWPLPADVVKQVKSITLDVPAFRSRSTISQMHAVRTATSGVVLSAEAMNCLLAQSWWGNVDELFSQLASLKQHVGIVDMNAMVNLIPGVLDSTALAPIKVMLSPTAIGEERVGGLTWDVEVGAMLIGRVASWHLFEEAAKGGDERAAQVCGVVDSKCPGFQPWCLDLSFLRRLSRAHVLLTLGEGGLFVHVLPRAGMRVEVESFEPGYARTMLKAGDSAPLGAAGSLTWVRAKTNAVYLRLFVFHGEAAYTTWSRQAAARLEETTTWDMGTINTMQETLLPNANPPAPVQASHVWAVNALEVEVLTDMLSSFRGGSLKRHLTHALREFEGDVAYSRVVEFVHHAPRLSQYLGRLYTLPENEPLRVALRQRYAHMPQPEDAMSYLPKVVRESI